MGPRARAGHFGGFGGDLLVGNFGDGRDQRVRPAHGAFEGRLTNEDGNPIQIDGLWALRVRQRRRSAPRTALLFTAGIDDEAHGLFGEIVAH